MFPPNLICRERKCGCIYSCTFNCLVKIVCFLCCPRISTPTLTPSMYAFMYVSFVHHLYRECYQSDIKCVLQEVRSFETELQLLKNLRHERIVTYDGTERADGKLYIFMEFMPGVSIRLLYYLIAAFPHSILYLRGLIFG